MPCYSVKTERQDRDPSACIMASISTDVMENPASSITSLVTGKPADIIALSSEYPIVLAAVGLTVGDPEKLLGQWAQDLLGEVPLGAYYRTGPWSGHDCG